MDKYVAFEYSVRELFETGIELGDTSRVGSYLDEEVKVGDETKLIIKLVPAANQASGGSTFPTIEKRAAKS